MILAWSALAAWADGCDRDPDVDDRLDGAVDVPTDALLPYSLGWYATDVALYDEDGVEVRASGQPLRPEEPLRPHTAYRLVLSDFFGEVLEEVSFVTGDGPTEVRAPPEIVGITFGAFVEETVSTCGGAHGWEITATVEVPEADVLSTLTLVAVDPAEEVAHDPVPVGPEPGRARVRGTSPSDEELCVTAVLHDAALDAHLSGPFCARAPGGGCATAGAPAGLLALALGALAIRGRR